MGPYCKFCDHRCFVPRIIPDGPDAGRYLILATCAAGMAHDRQETGHDHTSAINPRAGRGDRITDPAALELRRQDHR